jgi:catechol 2,3-dioxygenase-like lactoylglutathione lyase family enzyme
MERIRGIGGIFFRANDPAKLREWYRAHLGIDIDPSYGGATFGPTGDTVWSPFAADTAYFGSPREFMINYRVESLDRMLAQLRAAGVKVDDKTDDGEFGKFGWATDPEGNRFELWQPPAR